MVSVRDKNHRWNPKSQNPEISPLYNTFYLKDTELRVFPLSNWTEIDIWQYIKKENISVYARLF